MESIFRILQKREQMRNLQKDKNSLANTRDTKNKDNNKKK